MGTKRTEEFRADAVRSSSNQAALMHPQPEDQQPNLPSDLMLHLNSFTRSLVVTPG